MEIPKNLKEGILEANNNSKVLEIGPDYTTFTLETGKARYPTDVVRGVAEYIDGRLPRDADPVMAIGYKLNKMRDFYNKFKMPDSKPEKLDYIV